MKKVVKVLLKVMYHIIALVSIIFTSSCFAYVFYKAVRERCEELTPNMVKEDVKKLRKKINKEETMVKEIKIIGFR